MKRVLISWMAFSKDFSENGHNLVVNPKGPTGLIHNNLFEKERFDCHYLIQCQPIVGGDLEKKVKLMDEYLSKKYPTHQHEIEFLNIKEEELSDYKIVVSQLRSFLIKVSNYEEIEVITGTGSAIMHMAWVALFYSMDLTFKLYLMHHNPVIFPIPIPVPLTKSKILERKLKEFYIKESQLPDMVMDEFLKNTYKDAKELADADELNILILGETGTGKDLLANYIKNNSPRFDKLYLKINCASIDDALLHSELFGHVKGAFTDAKTPRDGLFKQCNGGTLFMDEIGDISLKMQASLLRVIQNKEIRPLGSDKVTEDIDVRIIAATNADLLEKCEKKEFRWDLYYRLCDCELTLEPFRNKDIRERKNILNKFIREAEEKWGTKLIMSPQAEKAFYNYDFPGNFREIRNTVNSLLAYKHRIVTERDLPRRIFRNSHNSVDNLKENEKILIERIYRESGYIISQTAKRLSYKNPYQLKLKMERLGISIANKEKKS